MRKLYALLAGICFVLAATPARAQTATPDVANFTYNIDASGNVVFTNTSVLGNLQGPRRAQWSFGDGSNEWTEPLQGTSHQYLAPGSYTVCLKIFRLLSNTSDPVVSAEVCKTIVIPAVCRADFERVAVSPTSSPLTVTLKALPLHSSDNRPVLICWDFGDGTDTCIQYSNTNPGPYTVTHTFPGPGEYEVCVKIVYQGGCIAIKCKKAVINRPDSCKADFEQLPITTSNNPLHTVFKALPWHNNQKKPARICWTFGDGKDTCISYPENYEGQYLMAHRYQQPGEYGVCVKITYYGGCEASNCDKIVVGRPDSCKADFERIPVAAANNQLTVAFRALSQHNNDKKPARICWKFGNGKDTCITYPQNYEGQYTVAHTYREAGDYEVCVKITYYGGCEASKCEKVIVPQQLCRANLVEITPSVNSLERGFYVTAASVPNRRIERICWDFGDGTDTCIVATGTGQPPLYIKHTYPGPGVYSACVKVFFRGGCVASDCEEVVIRSRNNLCGGYMTDSHINPKTVKFTAYGIHKPNDEVIGYRWNFGDGSHGSGKEVTHTYNVAGEYRVCLTMVTRSGCETKICNTVRVAGNNEPSLVLTPNPVTTVLNVLFRSTHTETVTIKVINANGITIRAFSRNVIRGVNNWNFDASNLLPGRYLFLIESPNQRASAFFLKL